MIFKVVVNYPEDRSLLSRTASEELAKILVTKYSPKEVDYIIDKLDCTAENEFYL